MNCSNDCCATPGSTSAATGSVPGNLTGYLHILYCQSLREIGAPRLLPESGGWIFEREIFRSQRRYAMGCYSPFSCQDWSRLQADLKVVENALVSLTIVADPMENIDPAELREGFPDITIAFKGHFLADLGRDLNSYVPAHHKHNVRKALGHVHVEKCDTPKSHVDEWSALYAELVERHGIRGNPAFSRASFATRLRVPGILVLRAGCGATKALRACAADHSLA